MNLQITGLTLPILVRPAVPLNDDELECFSRDNRPLRVERNKEGELVLMTPVTGKGNIRESYVYREFGNWALNDNRGIPFSASAGFTLPDGSCLSPDTSWVSFERWNALTDAQQDSFAPICPEFIIEVRSKSDSRRMLETKMQLWLENGAQLAWLIDPIDNTATIYRPNQPAETLERPDVLQGHPPVGTFQLVTTSLWT